MICDILFSLLLFLFYKLSRIIIHILIICIYVFSCNVLYRQRTHSLFAIDQCCQSLLCSVLYRAFVLYRGRRSSIIFSVCNTSKIGVSVIYFEYSSAAISFAVKLSKSGVMTINPFFADFTSS